MLGRRNDGLAIIAARDGAPARLAGLRSGDTVVKIDGVSAQGMLPADGEARLRGRPGTEVALTVIRRDWAEPKPVNLTRARPAADRVSDRALGDGIRYIRIPDLRASTAPALGRLLDAPGAPRPTGSWHGPGTRPVRRSCRVSPHTVFAFAAREDVPGGFKGEYFERSLGSTDLRPGDYATVITEREGGRIVATKVVVVRPGEGIGATLRAPAASHALKTAGRVAD